MGETTSLIKENTRKIVQYGIDTEKKDDEVLFR